MSEQLPEHVARDRVSWDEGNAPRHAEPEQIRRARKRSDDGR
jgi:hypothetical protein